MSDEERLQAGLKVAQQFAHALDRNDFITTAKLLAPNCVYTIHDQHIVGPEALGQQVAAQVLPRIGSVTEAELGGRCLTEAALFDVAPVKF